MSNENTKIAEIILKQLGGNRVRAMTGAKTFVAIERGLSFSFPNKIGPNVVRITLNGRDEYEMEFWKKWGAKLSLVEEVTGVYAEDLVDFFEKHTGLYLSL